MKEESNFSPPNQVSNTLNLEKAQGQLPNTVNCVPFPTKPISNFQIPSLQTKKISTKLQEFDSDNAFLVKHGNGRILPGLDEGLHTIRVGGKRRIIVPPKLGFVSNGLGPLPEAPWGRYKLNQLLNQMVEVKGGNLVFDVELRSAFDDEADQGYYEDRSLTPEQFQTLRNNFERGAREEREKQKMAAGIGEV
mmetsp:Transcript_12572/g.18606  ORF Transcript_12572/g.18606 Transcript_12572/m.18606 type:complete len:192 (+) Transcript_12572:389-964(+)